MRLLKACLIILVVILVSLLGYSILFGYRQSILQIAIFVNYDPVKILALITPGKFFVLQLLPAFVILIISVWLLYFNKSRYYLKILKFKIVSVIASLAQHFIQYQFLILIAIPFFASLYYLFELPVLYDEAWTYLNFTSRGIFASLTFYPAPNNHVLHSIITNLSAFLPGVGGLVSMRLPVVFINLLTWLVAFMYLKRNYNVRFAFLVVAIASMLYMNIYYSFLSRGYAMVNLAFIISFFSCTDIIRSKSVKWKYLWFIIASVTGLFTLPSYLYAVILLNGMILIYKWREIKNLVIADGIILILTLLFYSPLVIISGLDSLTNNGYVVAKPFTEVISRLPGFLYESLQAITGMEGYLVAALILMSLIMVAMNKQAAKNYLVLYIVLLFAPIVLLLIHSVIPFPRTFNYYGFLLVFLIFLPFYDRIQKLRWPVLSGIVIALQLLLLYNFNARVVRHMDYSISARRVIVQISGDKKYFSNEPLFETHLNFYQKSNNYENYSLVFRKRISANADTLRSYDFVILSTEFDRTVLRKPVIVTDYFNVY